MGHWNYRLIDHGEWVGLHEVHYDDAGKPRAYSSEPTTFAADTEDGLEAGKNTVVASLQMALKDAEGREVLPVSVFRKDEE